MLQFPVFKTLISSQYYQRQQLIPRLFFPFQKSNLHMTKWSFNQNTGIINKSEVPNLYFLDKTVTKKNEESLVPSISLNEFSSGERKVSVNGIQLNIFEQGQGNHAVLFLPSFLGTFTTDFRKVFKMMDTTKFRLICWDPPGYGKSRPPKRQYRKDYFLEDAQLVAQLMENLGHNNYSVLGWSHGGTTACTLAVEFPGRITKLIMSGAQAYIDEIAFPQNLKLSDTSTWSQQFLKAMLRIYGEDYLKYLLADWKEFILEYYNSGAGLANQLKDRSLLIKCPTLVFHGMKDPLVHIDHAHYFGKHIQSCKVRLISDGYHDLHLTHLSEFVTEVEEFLCCPN